jgi:T-complex protein 1 subunit theta
MGDATNLVLILAGELLKRAEHLLVMGLHPSEVVIGYEMAVEKGRQELECTSLDQTRSRCRCSHVHSSDGGKEPR